jgi:serine/threonine protein kinase/pimeloyl-ACP methyl ester carboxylesterase
VKAANWLNHLDYDWQSPVWQPLLEALTQEHTLLRYDARGNGLSDWDVDDISFEAFVSDLESVVDDAGLDRFPLFGISQGCAISIAYAVRHPERVSHLVLHGGYAQGTLKRDRSPTGEEHRRFQALLTLMRDGWGRDNPAMRQVFTSMFIPDGTEAEARWFNELQRMTSSPENAVRIREATGAIDVASLLGQVRAPTLVLHSREDEVVPFSEGQRLATEIPNARFVSLESRNHLVLGHEAAWPRFITEILAFLGTSKTKPVPPIGTTVTPAESAPKRWAVVDAIFDAALDRTPPERSEWIRQACGGDAKLERDVRQLVEHAERDDDALKPEGGLAGPIWEEVAEELGRGDRPEAFRSGDVLGSFAILGSLGAGGMGQVYVAEDRKLGRRVALKVLAPELDTPEYRKRFEREAKVVAALNHPNIVQVFSIHEADGIHFLTMELVHGKTLTEHIPDGGMPLSKFLEAATEMAEAIVAAHERGIIHRDLKPANVMMTDDGRVKILDFGLAKPAAGVTGLSLENSSTEGATREGHILGTVSYMSPEQAEGREIDHRTDIFSLGVVLYQMATGQLPFRGETSAAIVSSILRDSPDEVSDVRSKLPRELSRIIRKCLAKAPDRRYQSALDLRNDLEELRFQFDSKKLFRTVIHRPQRSLLPVVTAALIATAAIAIYLAFRATDVSRPPPRPTFSQLTATPDEETFPSLSPDGRFVAYASRIDGSWDINLLRVGGQRPINLTANAGGDETQPAFSPDGERIAFRSTRGDGGIFIMGATGEFVRQLTTTGWNPAWSPDGREIVFSTEGISRHPFDRPTRSELWIADVETGESRRLTEGDAVQPSWSPNGHRIAYWGLVRGTGQRDIWTISSKGGQPRPVTEDATVDWNPVWGERGDYLYYASERGGSMNLWRVAIDESSGELLDEPEPLAAPSSFASYASISDDGGRLAYASSSIERRLYAVAFDPESLQVAGEPRPIARDLRDVDAPAPSPSGDWLVFSRTGQEDILIAGLDGTQWRQLTDDPARDRQPVISPDGREIAFYSNRGGSYEVWVMGFDGSNLRAITDLPDRTVRYPFWSPDGERIGFSYPGTSGVLIDVGTSWAEQVPEELPPYPEAGNSFIPVDWSPDGSRVSGHLFTASGDRRGVVVVELATGTYEKLTDFGWFPTWMADSEHLLFMVQDIPSPEGGQGYLLDHRIFVVNRITKEYVEVLSRPGLSVEMPALTPDNRTLYFVQTSFESDIWLMERGGS